MDDLTLVELAEALRERIEQDQKLLSKVHAYITHENTKQPLDALDRLVPIDQIEARSGGRIPLNHARWLARHRDENGMEAAFQKIGKRLFVNMPVLTSALMEQGGRNESKR